MHEICGPHGSVDEGSNSLGSCEVHCVHLEGCPKRVKKWLFLEYPEEGWTYFLVNFAKYPTYPFTRRHSQGGTLATDVVRRAASGSTPWHATQVLVVRPTASVWRHNAYTNEYRRMLELRQILVNNSYLIQYWTFFCRSVSDSNWPQFWFGVDFLFNILHI